MKKKILILFLFLFASEVHAKTYYSDYGEYSLYSEKEILSSDTIYVESIEKYQLYSKEESYEYLLEYDGLFTGNTKEVETEWVDDYNLIDDSKPVDECYKYETINIKEFNHLLVDNQSEFNLIIKKFKLINNVDEIVLERSNIKLFDFSVYHIDLTKYGYKFDELKLEAIYEREDSSQTGDISVGYYLSKNGDHTNLEYKIKNLSTDSNMLEDNIDSFKIYSRYSNECYDVKPSNNRNYKTYYRNKYILKEYKVTSKNYINDYDVEPKDNYLLDKEKSKKFYRYKVRDKVEIKDELLIDNYDIKLTDFILESTVPLDDIKIISNVDYSKNGDYLIKFVLPFKTVEKNVKVNIEKNLINTINKQVEYINELKSSNEKNSYAVDKKNKEIKELILEEENKVNEALKELDSCYKNISSLKNQKQKLKVETKEKDYKKLYLVILIMLIGALIVIKKNIRKKIS